MANKSLFQTIVGALLPKTDAINEAGGRAYALSPKHALAQYAATGCLNGTFYANAEEQLATVLTLANAVEPEFVAKTAIHARRVGLMKDMPALLMAVLAGRDIALFKRAFPKVCDNGKMVRNVVQIIRSGQTGRKSLGSAPRNQIRAWLDGLRDDQLLHATIGNDPSLADLVKMVHPKPKDPARRAFYAWLIGKPFDEAALPEPVRKFEVWKRNRGQDVPDVPFQLLTAEPLTDRQWLDIARTASWQVTRQNLNTFLRHGVFKHGSYIDLVAQRLADPVLIAKAKAFPYQLQAAYTNAEAELPGKIREALQVAMEHATANVPAIPGAVYVCPDVSGSMRSAVTGQRGTATSTVTCLEVAALVAASVLRINRQAGVIPFSDQVVRCTLNPRDSVMTNAKTLAALPSGGTACSAPLAELNRRGAQVDAVILVSDNESWVDVRHGRGTAVLEEWAKIQRRCPGAKLVCLDLQPNATAQAPDRADILNVGGFSDGVWTTIAHFVSGTLHADHWVGVIGAEEV